MRSPGRELNEQNGDPGHMSRDDVGTTPGEGAHAHLAGGPMSTTTTGRPAVPEPARPRRKDRTHYLYIAVIVAVGLGIAVGLVAPDFAIELKPLGDAFVALIKMMIQPVIFCTIVLGVGSVRSAER